jgi:hypothetical protein
MVASLPSPFFFQTIMAVAVTGNIKLWYNVGPV